MFKHEEIYGGDTQGADITQKEMDTERGSEEWRVEILSFFFFHWYYFIGFDVNALLL